MKYKNELAKDHMKVTQTKIVTKRTNEEKDENQKRKQNIIRNYL